MDFKRGHERKDLKVFLKVLDMNTNETFGYLVNITREGVMLTKDQGVETDQKFQLKVILPSEIDGKKEFSFSAKSSWSKKDSESEFYNIGMQFIDLAPGDLIIIDKLVNDFCFNTD